MGVLRAGPPPADQHHVRFLASLIGLYLAWHKTHNMFGMLLYAQREKAAVEKETSTQAAVSQFQPHFYQQYAVHHSNFMR